MAHAVIEAMDCNLGNLGLESSTVGVGNCSSVSEKSHLTGEHVQTVERRSSRRGWSWSSGKVSDS